MPEREPDFSNEAKEPKIKFEGSMMERDELNLDLWNALTSAYAPFLGDVSVPDFEEKLRAGLKRAKTWEEYYSNYNTSQPEYIAEANAFFNPDTINQFNEKVFALRALADDEKIDVKKAEHILWEEILPMLGSKKYKAQEKDKKEKKEREKRAQEEYEKFMEEEEKSK